jgi:DNA primase
MADTRRIVEDTLSRFLPRGHRVGDEFVSPCPFHKGGQEKSASFSVSLETGMAFCHTCHEGWGLRMLLVDMGVSAIEVDTVMARLPELKAPGKSLLREEGAFDGTMLPEQMLLQFRRCPTELLDAGFDIETLQYFDVGYDEQRGRITYPIRNHRGGLIGVYGRYPDGEGPKYRPYTEEIQEFEPRYRIGKKFFMWNFHRVYPLAWKEELDYLIIVEGFKQLMRVWEAGYDGVISLLGSYLTKGQKTLIERLNCDLWLFLDDDPAGWSGTLQVAKSLRAHRRIRICKYPEGAKQPDDMGREEIVEAVDKAESLMKWRRDRGI